MLGDAFSEERCAWCVQSLVFMFLLQTHRDTAPLPTAKLTSNPAGWWAWIPGSESQPLDLTKALYFDQTSIYLVFCHLHLYSLSHRWPGHHIAIFNNLALFLFELLFFKVGFASFGRKIESFQFCPYLNLTLCLHTSHWKQGDAQLMTFWMTLYRWRVALGGTMVVSPLQDFE